MRPDCGYRRDYLWLPKALVPNVRGLQACLSFPILGEAPISAWDQNSTHLIVPRNFVQPAAWKDLGFPVHDITPREFPAVDVHTRSTLKNAHQRLGFEALVDFGDGVLSLQPGQGKTVVALHAWTTQKVPAIIITHNSGLAYQWRERVQEHTSISADEIGWVQEDRWDWEKPIVMASMQTLVSRVDEIPEEMRRHFGVVIFDEVHHLGAREFNKTAGMFYGTRWGLSATPEREDGMTALYQYHIGPVLYAFGEHDVIPEVFFKRTGVFVPAQDLPEIRDKTGEVNCPRLYGWLGRHGGRNDLICSAIAECQLEGRKILVLSEIVEHLKLLHGRFPGSGLLTGQGKETMENRHKILYEHGVVFATMKLAQEGLDRKELDTLIIVTPLSSEGRFRQILGRIQRESSGKQPPIALVFEDEKIEQCKNMCRKLKNHLVALHYPHSTVGP